MFTEVSRLQEPVPPPSKNTVSKGPGTGDPEGPPEERDQFVELKELSGDATQYLLMVSRLKECYIIWLYELEHY